MTIDVLGVAKKTFTHAAPFKLFGPDRSTKPFTSKMGSNFHALGTNKYHFPLKLSILLIFFHVMSSKKKIAFVSIKLIKSCCQHHFMLLMCEISYSNAKNFWISLPTFQKMFSGYTFIVIFIQVPLQQGFFNLLYCLTYLLNFYTIAAYRLHVEN